MTDPPNPLGLGTPFALMLVLLAVYWLLRVGREARAGFVPRVAWWGVPGLLLLLLTPVLDVPALFGVGAGLLLLSEFWPGAYVRARQRPGWAWPLVALVVGIALTLGVTAPTPLTRVGVISALAGLLVGTAGILPALLWPRPAPRPLGFETRWKAAVTPDFPDLSVSVSPRGAHLKNVSSRPLQVAGWAPAGINAWYRVRGDDGRALNLLRAGQVVLLPLDDQASGVRVWYAPQPTAAPHLFRADWTPPARAGGRVLN
ncbi:hypothetical protein [Deinococcus navajonensis]|uniref:Uncharacterized protein n=1 Tax=Deinococcus navajonensis TaxID=309884 RepID=A0ABV8XMG9_9DEIO